MTPHLSFSGYSGTGKTTLLIKVVEELTKRSIKVSVLKHDGHKFQMDKEGKDTYRLKEAGAYSVSISNNSKYAMISDTDHRLSFYELMEILPKGIDIVLGEGFKDDVVPKILIHRKEISELDKNKVNLYGIERNIIAVATDSPEEFPKDIPIFNINDYLGVTDFITNYGKLK